jgi:SnoaL-like domain
MSEALIRRYYDWFNDRKFSDAAGLFSDEAKFEPPFGQPEPGRAGYLQFTAVWTQAFPNAKLTIDRVDERRDTIREVYLFASGKHQETLRLGPYHFKATGAGAVLHIRELLDVRHDRIMLSTVTVDLNDLITQLVKVDYAELARRLERIGRLNEELSRIIGNVDRERIVVTQLGAEVDAARRTLRPYFTR